MPQAKISSSLRYPRYSFGVSEERSDWTAWVSRSSEKTNVFGLEVALVMILAIKRGDEAEDELVRSMNG